MPEARQSVIYLVPGFPAGPADTDCLPAVQNAVAAVAARHPERRVYAVAFQYPFRRRAYRWSGVAVCAVGGCNRRGLRRLVTWIRAFAIVWRLARRTRVVALHSFWLGECAWVGRWLSRWLGVRHVASIAGQDALPANPYLRLLDPARTTVTAGSAFAAEHYRRATGRAVDAVVPLGLDAGYLRGIAAGGPRDVDVLGVGSLVPVKDYAAFVRVVARLVPAFPALRAVLVGEGPERARIEAQVEAAGLGAHVRLTGRLPREEAYRWMLRSRVLLHPARYEAQGYVLLEAAQAGLHVVCRDVGHPAPGAVRCGTEAEMEATLGRLLRSEPPPPVAVPTAEETAQAFTTLYFENRKTKTGKRV